MHQGIRMHGGRLIKWTDRWKITSSLRAIRVGGSFLCIVFLLCGFLSWSIVTFLLCVLYALISKFNALIFLILSLLFEGSYTRVASLVMSLCGSRWVFIFLWMVVVFEPSLRGLFTRRPYGHFGRYLLIDPEVFSHRSCCLSFVTSSVHLYSDTAMAVVLLTASAMTLASSRDSCTASSMSSMPNLLPA